MRSQISRRLLLIAAASALLVLGSAGTARAQDDPPPGATDGVPVGAEPDEGVATDGPTAGSEPAGDDDGVSTASSTPPERYFSREAYQDIEAAAAEAVRPCAVSVQGLKALVLSPIFFESSGALSATSAPSPMTLSRYDEWNPSYHPTQSNLGANQSLYEGRNPWTPYPRAYWHPGIGIWQYDSAGLGAPYTAVQRMDSRVIAPAVSARVLGRYCTAKAAGASDAAARRAAWGDWVGCANNGCEAVFQELYQHNFAQMRLLDSISRLGGTEIRSCSVPGRDPFPCAYVDHRKAQGARWWAVNSTAVPINDGDPTKPPAPLALPFYQFELDGREHRHWLTVDTGYPVMVSASRQIGRNARYRTDQTGSGLNWSRSSELCDLTAARGACLPVPPAGVTATALRISGQYRTITLDADGDGRGDVLWYAPGPGPDYLWLGRGGGSFDQVSLTVNGTYAYAEPLDFDGDGRDDLLWYDPATGQAHVWRSMSGNRFSSVPHTPGTGRVPVVLDADGDGSDEILWYGPGSTPDSQWSWNGSGFSASPRTVSGAYQPYVGDFDGNGLDDVFWLAAGTATDHMWAHSTKGGYVSSAHNAPSEARPLIGDFDGDTADDIFWYAPGPATDAVWFGAGWSRFSARPASVSGSYQPLIADLLGEKRQGIIWYAPGKAADSWWRWNKDRALRNDPLSIQREYRALVGGFSTGGADGVLWYAPGSEIDALWYR